MLQSENRCEWCCRLYEGRYAESSLKSHYTKGCDHKPKSRVGTRAERAAIRKKRRAVQQQQEKVMLQGVELENVYEFKYLGFWFVADADRRYAADVSMAKAATRFGQLWQIWAAAYSHSQQRSDCLVRQWCQCWHMAVRPGCWMGSNGFAERMVCQMHGKAD